MTLKNEGVAWVFGDDINTDLILPSSAFLLPVEDQAKHCFSANRPGWSGIVQRGDIVVAGTNFGLGSARPIGKVLAHLGVAGIIASSFNGLGLRNCVNYGIHVLPCPGAKDLIEDGDRVEVNWQKGSVRNLTNDSEFLGRAVPQPLLDIAEKGGVIPMLQAEGLIEEVESKTTQDELQSP